MTENELRDLIDRMLNQPKTVEEDTDDEAAQAAFMIE